MEPKLYLNKVVSFSEKKKKTSQLNAFFFFQGKEQIGRKAIKSINPSGNNPTFMVIQSKRRTSRESDFVGLAWGPGMCIKKKNYWSIVDLQYCVTFCYTAK